MSAGVMEDFDEPSEYKVIETESYLRIAVRSLYDMQKLRIQIGNRIVAAFREKLGIKPSHSEEEEGNKEAEKLLVQLRAEYRRITDGVKRITKKIKSDSHLITTQSELLLLKAYEEQLQAEETHKKIIENELKDYPVYMQYMRHIKGVGPLMAAMCISELDIHRAKVPSAFHAYSGIDVVTWFECKEKHNDAAPDRLRKRHPEGYTTQGPAITGREDDWFSLFTADGVLLGKYGLANEDSPGYGEGRSMKETHLTDKTYVKKARPAKNGKPATEDTLVKTRGITFNPMLKTKLIGVLASSFVRQGGVDKETGLRKAGCYYRNVFDSYKEYITGRPEHANKTKIHINNMAKRYMIKEFLSDLWTAWRTLEELPIRPSYAVEKLGKRPYVIPGKPEIIYDEVA
jgi:hypothetical protein